jgi:hypothetical protein
VPIVSAALPLVCSCNTPDVSEVSVNPDADAFIIVEHGKIYFRSPYNKQFITDFKNHSPGLLTWNIEYILQHWQS